MGLVAGSESAVDEIDQTSSFSGNPGSRVSCSSVVFDVDKNIGGGGLLGMYDGKMSSVGIWISLW